MLMSMKLAENEEQFWRLGFKEYCIQSLGGDISLVFIWTPVMNW